MIRYIKLSSNAKYLVAAEFEKILHVWDFFYKKKLYTIKTSFSTSSERYAISNDESILASCSWDKKSIVLHDLSDGSTIWENKEINHIDSLIFSANDKNIYVQQEKYFYNIDTFNGVVIGRNKYDCQRIDSANNDYCVEIINKHYYILKNNNIIFDIPLRSFACLDLCFSEKHLFVSEAGADIRCISLESGKELWTFKPEENTHFLKISYNRNNGIVYAVLYKYTDPLYNSLFIFDACNGRVENKFKLNKNLIDRCFDNHGKILVTAIGDIYYLDKDIAKIKTEKIEFE